LEYGKDLAAPGNYAGGVKTIFYKAMNRERWQKVKEIFDAALKLAPERRRKFLDENCAEDKTLRREVENLLASFADDSFMEQHAAAEVASVIIKGEAKNLEAGKCFGHYEILRQIGAGGMGEVYLAADKKLDRKVAIKILNEKFNRHESNLDRFVREAKAASGLNHPNILVIHEIGEAQDTHYIVSEFVEGATLREHFKESAAKPSEVLDVAIQIASALCAAHASGIAHRDIKPENIIIRADGYAKILDFGLAKLIERKAIGFEDATVRQNETATGVILGTVNYMSPEQAKGERVDVTTDIFSLGAVIYEMIAGRTPFVGNTVSETLANLINSEPPPLARYAEGVPDELQRIVSKMLRKNKDERYQTMKDVLADLKSLRENLAFDERLEKSHSPTDKNATAILEATTDATNNRTDETNDNFIGQIKRRKSLAAFALTALLIGAIGFGYYFWSEKKPASGAVGKKSLAVLPFVNASQDPNAEYLSDGITESVINNLSQLAGLKVMSRNSAFRFKDNQTDTKNIASQLGVEMLVTGDIKQLGDRLVINVRLIDASDDSQIWGNQYVKNSTDILTTQNEIAQAVAANLRVRLSNSEQQQLAKNFTENSEAYQLYLRGRFHVFKLTPPEIQKGISYFQQAIEIDPNYALPYAGLADANRSLAVGSEMSPTEFLPKAITAANKAVELDDALSEAHATLGATLFWQWSWNEAENQFKRALELNPNDANVHTFYAHLLSNTGRHEEAVTKIKRARELDPLFPFAGALEGQFLLHAGRADEALDRLKKTFELAPNFWMPHLFASSVYTEKGMYSEAVVEARKAGELSPAQTISVAFEGYALAKLGKTDEARALLNELQKLSTTRFVPSGHIALIYNGLGETEEALKWLEKAYVQRDPKMAFLKVEPKWNNLRNEPRFIELMRQMNF
jgi:serine/threonine-protein kinase